MGEQLEEMGRSGNRGQTCLNNIYMIYIYILSIYPLTIFDQKMLGVWNCLDLIWNPDVQQPEQARLGVFESLTKDIPGDTAGSKQQTSNSLAD